MARTRHHNVYARASAHRGGGDGLGRRRPKKGIGQKKDKGVFWAGMLMGAATATGGFFAVKALERAFAVKKEGSAIENPGPSPAHQRLLAQATGAPGATQPPAMLTGAAKPPVVKRTIIEEMVDDLDE